MRKQYGHTLIDALISFVVISISALAATRLHMSLNLDSDVARQRSEAVRMMQQDIERLRAFASLDGPHHPAYTDIRSDARTRADTNAMYEVQRTVTASARNDYRDVDVNIAWRDRAGGQHRVGMTTIVAGVDPRFSAFLALPAPASRADHPQMRHAGIPPRAVDLGNGRSIFSLPGANLVYVVFDNATGEIMARCAGPVPTIPDAICEDNTTARYVGGFVRFAEMSSSQHALPPELQEGVARDLDMTVQLASPEHSTQAAECHDDSISAVKNGRSHIAYGCIVHLGSKTVTWSGRSTVIPRGPAWGPLPPVLSTAPGRFKVCRYSSDANGDGLIGNHEHPSTYLEVEASLPNQNFLVVPGIAACPSADAASDSWHGGTAQHDPETQA